MIFSLLASVSFAEATESADKDCKIQVRNIVEMVKIDENNPDHPAMNVEWKIQKCGAGDQQHHEIVLHSDVFTMEKNMDAGLVVSWF